MSGWMLIGYLTIAVVAGVGIGVTTTLWHYRKNGPRMRKLRRDAAPMLVDMHGTDQMIVMTRPTFDNLNADLLAQAPPPGYTKLWPDGQPWLSSPIVPPKDNPFRNLGEL
jgi:hypothetical protein